MIRTPILPTLRLSLAVTLGAALIVAVACSSNNSGATSNTNASSGNRANAAAPVASSQAAAGPQNITEIATDNKYSQPDLTVKANQTITFALNNQGQAIHNWHVLGVKDKDGKDIATKLLNGGQSDTIIFVITQPGKYKVQCDAHPADMTGLLTVTQ